MVKNNVCFFALSLLMPAVVLSANWDYKRDVAHAVVGALETFALEQSGCNGKGVDLAKKGSDWQTHATTVSTSYIKGDGAVASLAGRLHVEYLGKLANSLVSSNPHAKTTVTLRDQWTRTAGQVLTKAYCQKGVDTTTLTSTIDPFLAASTVQYLWANRASLTQAAQADLQAAQTGYNAAVAAQAAQTPAKK